MRPETVPADAHLYALAERLFPLPRTVQGPAVLETLDLIDRWLWEPLVRHEVPVGMKVFDWTVLPEYENRRHYHPSLDDLPPYDGPLVWAEAVLPGQSSQEVLLSTYTCHPSLANDNVSGLVVTAALAQWLGSRDRRYTYRILFAPETIGALCWLHAQDIRTPWKGPILRDRIIAGYTINCCGDERAWSFVPSRKGDTLADRAARHVLDHTSPLTNFFDWKLGWKKYAYADRGSDERQFCAPRVDLPIASVMRSKHGTFPEYHTPADNLSVISAKGLGDSFRCYQRIIEAIEANRTYEVRTTGEPCLSKYGLYPTTGGPDETARIARDLCAYSDGETDLLAIAEATGRDIATLVPVAVKLAQASVLRCA